MCSFDQEQLPPTSSTIDTRKALEIEFGYIWLAESTHKYN